ncbi:MAG TPA: RES family NAD+ phosphorylase [Ferruginibacter sp.]|nr:RES family NAD+ phosphorylase [Ferruginibacter sp.]
MIVYRISNSTHSDDLSGTGSKIMGSRWNSKGTPVLYTSQHISLSVLEMLVNTNFKDYAIALDLLYIRLPEQQAIKTIELSSLKDTWKDDPEYTRYIGDEFIKQKQSLILRVPSAVINEEYNYLANPLHADFKKIKIIKTKSFWPDERLFNI